MGKCYKKNSYWDKKKIQICEEENFRCFDCKETFAIEDLTMKMIDTKGKMELDNLYIVCDDCLEIQRAEKNESDREEWEKAKKSNLNFGDVFLTEEQYEKIVSCFDNKSYADEAIKQFGEDLRAQTKKWTFHYCLIMRRIKQAQERRRINEELKKAKKLIEESKRREEKRSLDIGPELVEIKKEYSSEIEEVCVYWDSLHRLNVVLTPRGITSLRTFLGFFAPEIIKIAMDISAKHIGGDSIEDLSYRFKYMCKVLWNWKKEDEPEERNLRKY